MECPSVEYLEHGVRHIPAKLSETGADLMNLLPSDRNAPSRLDRANQLALSVE